MSATANVNGRPAGVPPLTPPINEQPAEQIFTPYSFDDLMAMPPKTWLIDQVIGAGDIGMLYGAPGCGKTFVGINMIVSACTGWQWAARFDVARPLNVAYCAGEGISGLPARFKAALAIHSLKTLPNFTFFKTMPQLFTGDRPGAVATIRQFVTEWKARQAAGRANALDILFIDTLHTATTSADENSAQDMGQVLSACRSASNELGCAVILVHHTNKNGTAERGSSALRGAMDVMIEIRRISDVGTKAVMQCAKLKDGEQWQQQTFDLHAVTECSSACVLWDAPSDGDSPTSKQNEDVQAIITLLSGKPGLRYTAKSVAEGIGLTPTSTQIFKLIKRAMLADESIKSGLKFPDKDSHATNPTMYWYSSTDSLTH